MGLESLRRRRNDRMLRHWSNHECFMESTQEGRRAMRAATDVSCSHSSARRGDSRGGGTSMRGQTFNGRRGEMMCDGIRDGVKCGQRKGSHCSAWDMRKDEGGANAKEWSKKVKWSVYASTI